MHNEQSSIIGPNIQDAAGPLQLCAGQLGGCETAIYTVRSLFSEPESEGLLMVDATNAFNSVNRKLALINASSHLCPSFSKFMINTYRDPIDLFIDGECVLSTGNYTSGLLKLVEFADSQLHASSVLIHGLFRKWAFLARTTSNIAPFCQPLETTIHTKLFLSF